MENIRDRTIKNNKWTEDSDWFSFAIIIFQMWIGIHPYKGKHPNYKPDEWLKRMEDGISIFDKDVTIPKLCEDFSIIPKSHLNWMKDIFLKNKRYHPPELSDDIQFSVPEQFRFVNVNSNFEINLELEIRETIKDVFNILGINYIVGSTKLFKDKNDLSIDTVNCKKVFICNTGDFSPIVCKLKNDTLISEDISGKVVHTVKTSNAMSRNGCVYYICGDQLVESVYNKFGNNIVCSASVSSNIHPLSTQIFDGVVFHNLLGKNYIVLPYEKSKCINMYVPELDGYRLIDAKSEKNICGIIAEKKGQYDRFILDFNPSFIKYDIRKTNGVQYCEINLTVLPNGVTILACQDCVEIFKGSGVKIVDNPPFNSVTKIFNVNGKFFFVDGNKIFSSKMK